MKIFFCLGFFSLVVLAHIAQGADKVEEPLQEPQVTEKSEASSSNDASQSADESESPTKVADEAGGSEEDKKYALGSLCNYCSYCKVGIEQGLVVGLPFQLTVILNAETASISSFVNVSRERSIFRF